MNPAWRCGVFILLAKACFEQVPVVRFSRTDLSLNAIGYSTRSFVVVVHGDKL